MSLRVADLARSAAFYTAFFGLPPKDRTARYSTFIVPHLHLNLVLLVNDRGEALDTYSLYHLGLGVAGKAEVIAAHHAAVAAGAEVGFAAAVAGAADGSGAEGLSHAIECGGGEGDLCAGLDGTLQQL